MLGSQHRMQTPFRGELFRKAPKRTHSFEHVTRLRIRATADPDTTTKKSSLELMRNFSETYCKRSGTYFCTDKSVTATVINGLAEHKEQVGAPLCPCRHYDDKAAEVKLGYWNCPCVPMRERKECHCMLFLTKDNPFVGEDQEITMDEISAATGA